MYCYGFLSSIREKKNHPGLSNKEVTDEVLEKVLSAAFKAPTNDHLRQFEFIVVRGRKTLPDSYRLWRKTQGTFNRQGLMLLPT